jgi:nicotinamidase-related amidase
MAGSADLALTPELRAALRDHLALLRVGYEARGWGRRSGPGARPAVVVVDLALGWTDSRHELLGSDLDSVVAASRRVLDAARAAGVPVFFTTMIRGADDPPSPADRKIDPTRDTQRPGSLAVELDPRLGRLPTEKLIVKKYASCFQGTDFMEMLTALGVDTLIVTGCGTSHCVYATCRDAASAFRVIVPEEAIGERCELLHEVFKFDIDLGLGDVLPLADVLRYLESRRPAIPSKGCADGDDAPPPVAAPHSAGTGNTGR